MLVAAEERDLRQVIGFAFDCRGSAAVIIQLIQIRFCRNIHGHRLCRLVNRFALSVFSHRIGQRNGIGADHKAGNDVLFNLGITLIGGQLPFVLVGVEGHILAVLILCGHFQRGQIKGIGRIVVINQIRDGSGNRKCIEIPFRQNLQLHAIGFRAVDNGIDLISARFRKGDGSRCRINGNAVALFRIPFDLSGRVEIVAVFILGGNGQLGNIGGVAAVIEIERIETAFQCYGGEFHRIDGQFNQLTVEISRCLNGAVRLIAEEQFFFIIGFQRFQHGIAVPVCRDFGIFRSVVEILIHNRPCTAQPGVEAIPGDVIGIESIDLNAVEAHILLFIQFNGLGIGDEPIQSIEGIDLTGRDNGVFGGIVEIAEIRRHRLTGEQCIRCGFKVALIEARHIQSVGIVARNIAVLNSGVQIFHGRSAVAAEGIFFILPAFPMSHVGTDKLVVVITGNREDHGLVFDTHRAAIRNGRGGIRHIDIDIDTGVRRQRNGDGVLNGLRIRFFFTGLIGFIHAVSIDKFFFHMGAGRKRRKDRNIEFHRNGSLFAPALRIGVGNRRRGGGALFVGIALFHGIFKVVAVFRRDLIAVGAAAQRESVALLFQTFDGIVIGYFRTCETILHTFDFEVIKKLDIVTVAAALIPAVLRHPVVIGSCRDIINRSFRIRQAVQNAGTVEDSIFQNDVTDSRPQTIGRILYILIIG